MCKNFILPEQRKLTEDLKTASTLGITENKKGKDFEFFSSNSSLTT
jgi:hypothetical protein